MWFASATIETRGLELGHGSYSAYATCRWDRFGTGVGAPRRLVLAAARSVGAEFGVRAAEGPVHDGEEHGEVGD